MNMYRFLATAAAGSALLAVVAPSAQALDLGSTLSSTAKTATVAGEKAKPVVDQVLGDTAGKKVAAVKGVLKGGSDVVKNGNALLHG
ncbi:hypothetical protein [Streptomyces sp. 150FB]|jgi:hypothetical protein|uniref:hypothetical protein n=1 Tax=Streptomyces sp. 150FB TaxID=1576605 RepID=UPI000AFE484E|nr:hypothetical protein [Streptomyces sp. 150FB]